MVGKQRGTVRALITVLAVAGLGFTGPAAAAAGRDGTDSGGDGRSPEADRLARERAVVPKGPLHFGAEAYRAVREAAEAAASTASCPISADDAAGLALAPTWPETAGSGRAPSPMTLSRYDAQPALADPQRRGGGLFFNPGVGIWQLDSAGLGARETAATAIDSVGAANRMVPYVVGKYCRARETAPDRARARAWSDWHACDRGACETIFQRLRTERVVVDPGVTRFGGAQPRTCSYEGVDHDCLYVDPRRAEGERGWTAPGYGPAPVPAPFYVFTYDQGGTAYEVRYWLKDDSGSGADVSASRELGVNARTKLTWSAEAGLCDTTADRGAC
ncbi:hypothetical protein [Saccharopolyspora rosea]|uniref:hypothetical protein n=1 Tax=Saccharopolyspora rosea TaxID=524884 RepID=UPI0021D8C40A|nr:hypothetical protein [Saccharopolyspora rosea]